MNDWLQSVLTGVSARPVPILHLELDGYPSTHDRLHKAECGRYVDVRGLADHMDRVTCPACRRRIEAREQTEI